MCTRRAAGIKPRYQAAAGVLHRCTGHREVFVALPQCYQRAAEHPLSCVALIICMTTGAACTRHPPPWMADHWNSLLPLERAANGFTKAM
mmetsp:Transcript_54111/g.89816  ORF Transcript_54111/g.89816 Transcript_54111/m.89816 type:complete len:90 (+) Transcript_54111:818-1087(+)